MISAKFILINFSKNYRSNIVDTLFLNISYKIKHRKYIQKLFDDIIAIEIECQIQPFYTFYMIKEEEESNRSVCSTRSLVYVVRLFHSCIRSTFDTLLQSFVISATIFLCIGRLFLISFHFFC